MPDPVGLPQFLKLPDAPTHLQDQVMTAIRRSLLRRVWMELALVVGGTLAFLGYVAVSWPAFLSELESSSFWQYTKLAWTDPDVFFSNSADTLLGLVEALPIATILFALVFAFLISCLIGFFMRLRAVRHSYPDYAITHHV